MSRAKPRSKKTPSLPPHINAEPHRRLMAKLAKMTPEEIFQTGVRSGIYTKTGKLRKPYAPSPSDPKQ